jgi:predicted amidophosphoribosyltransferase
MIVRYCPECREEFQPHVVTCSDCGGPLEDRDDTETAQSPAGPDEEPEDAAIPGAVPVFDTADTGDVHAAADALAGAAVPFDVKGSRRGLQVRVAAEDRERARSVLATAGLVGPDDGSPAVALTGGACPACGAQVAPGAESCPECDLQLAGGELSCPGCGAAVPPDAERCPGCGADLG